jgi:hypothetical protein
MASFRGEIRLQHSLQRETGTNIVPNEIRRRTSAFTWPTGSVNNALANTSKPDDYFTYHQVRPLKILHTAHRMHYSVLWISEQKGIISPLMCIPLRLEFIFFTHGATTSSGLGPPHYKGFTITLRHATVGRTLLDE